MRLNLHAIIHSPGASLPFDFSMDLSETELNGERPLQKPLHISGLVRNTADVLRLEGRASTDLSLCCDRCMKPFCREKTTALHYLLVKELQDEEESELLLLDGDELDLDELAFTAFLLDMDTKNICSEDCKGLCFGCGVNLNEESCRCKAEADPRWSALSQLLDKPE